MDVRLVELARRHDGVVTWGGLRTAGMTRGEVGHAVAGLRRLHDGAFLTGHGRITEHQRWLAATLTAPGTVLSHSSAGALHGFRPWAGGFEVVTRPGSGGPRRIGDLLVCRSRTLAGEVILRDGVSVTTPARTIVDLCPFLDERARAKAAREAIRLGTMTATELAATAARHRGRRGTAGLAELAAVLGRLPIVRTRSDAEARALEVLDAAGAPPPSVNVHCAGEEADLSWPQHGLIVEIDGPQFHRDTSEDRRKERAWRSAGWTVRRVPSDAVFDDPGRVIDAAAP